MINFTARYINIISLIISVIIFLFLNNYILSIPKLDSNKLNLENQEQTQIEQKNTSINNTTKENSNTNTVNQAEKTQKSNNEQKTNNNKVQKQATATPSKNSKQKEQWTIEIPAINLKAEIAEGTTKEIMDSYIGHFEDTSKDNGNIGLAAHNRGYKVNYFQNLKKLKEGDEIIYKYNGKQRKYKVKTLKIITDTDWTLLENTNENKITLITCVENQPEYRRCVQAVEAT